MHNLLIYNMLTVFIVSLIVIAFCVILMCIKIIFIPNGKFPDTHVSGNKGLKNKGITCAKSQDLQEQQKKNIFELSKLVNE